jgi:tRNA pseudouridine55 synthase
MEVDPPQREVTIHALDLLSYQPPYLTLRVASSSGTYIRSLAHDLGQALGCGGHVSALRRTAVGRFTLVDSVALDKLTAENVTARLLPPEAAVAHLPRVEFDDQAAAQLLLGRRVPASPEETSANTAAFGPEGRFLGIVAAIEGEWQPRKIFDADPLP